MIEELSQELNQDYCFLDEVIICNEVIKGFFLFVGLSFLDFYSIQQIFDFGFDQIYDLLFRFLCFFGGLCLKFLFEVELIIC